MAIQINITERYGRQCASSGSKWEPKMGYSRAVKVGNMIAVTGTVGVMDDGTYPETLAEQTQRSLDIILAALAAYGAKAEHIFRTRIFTTKIEEWEQIAGVHGKVFGEIRPATTLIGVAKLIDEAAFIEIEADAILL